MDKTYTIHEVMDILHCSYDTIVKHINAGRLPAFKVGTTWLIDKSDLDTFKENRKNASQQRTLAELERMCENHGLKLYRDCDSITYKESNTFYLNRDQKMYCVNNLENQCMDSIRKMLGLTLH